MKVSDRLLQKRRFRDRRSSVMEEILVPTEKSLRSVYGICFYLSFKISFAHFACQ